MPGAHRPAYRARCEEMAKSAGDDAHGDSYARSESTRAAQPPRSTIGIVDQPVQGSGEQPRATRQRDLRPSPELTLWFIAATVGVVPTVEAVRGGGHDIEELHRIDKIGVVAVLSAQVFAS